MKSEESQDEDEDGALKKLHLETYDKEDGKNIINNIRSPSVFQ